MSGKTKNKKRVSRLNDVQKFHKLNRDTFQNIDPILAHVTSYRELINGFPAVRSVRWFREKVPSFT